MDFVDDSKTTPAVYLMVRAMSFVIIMAALRSRCGHYPTVSSLS